MVITFCIFTKYHVLAHYIDRIQIDKCVENMNSLAMEIRYENIKMKWNRNEFDVIYSEK